EPWSRISDLLMARRMLLRYGEAQRRAGLVVRPTLGHSRAGRAHRRARGNPGQLSRDRARLRTRLEGWASHLSRQRPQPYPLRGAPAGRHPRPAEAPRLAGTVVARAHRVARARQPDGRLEDTPLPGRAALERARR